MPAFDHTAAYTAFKEFYQEELDRNPLYRHAVEMLKKPDCLPPEARREAIADLHEFERRCFKSSLARLNVLSDGHAADIVKQNDFFFFRTAFDPL